MGGVALGSIAAPVVVDAVGARAAFVAVGAILPLLTLVTYRRLVEIDSAVAPGPRAGADRAGADVRAALGRGEGARRGEPRPGVGRCRRGRDPCRRGRGSLLHRRRRRARDRRGRASHDRAAQADYFGEIALLRDVPRTATVTAIVDSQLYFLQREDFLAAVTGHRVAHAAGNAVAEERLARIEPMES